jgi:RNA polymerase sigma-70 factor (ECF subfamily)
MPATSENDFDEIYKTYHSYVKKFCIRIVNDCDVDDMVQETFLKCYLKMWQYDNAKSKFSTWLIQIAKNNCYDHFKKVSARKIIKEPIEELENALIDHRENAHDLLVKNRNAREIKEILCQLKEKERRIIELKFYEGKKYKDISKELNISNDVSRQRVSKTIKKLKTMIAS